MRRLVVGATAAFLSCESGDKQVIPDNTGAFPLDTADESRGVARCASDLSAEDMARLVRSVAARSVPPEPAIPGAVIDVYFHVLHKGNKGLVSDARIDDQMLILNNAFANTGWSFNLAEVDDLDDPVLFQIEKWDATLQPEANERDIAELLRKGDHDDLNVYTGETVPDPVDGAKFVGWAHFPWEYQFTPGYDGVVVLHKAIAGDRYVQRIPYQRDLIYGGGETLVHEVGHWMGLLHTFQDDSEPPDCEGVGDMVDDTPTAIPADGIELPFCPSGAVARDSCPEEDTDGDGIADLFVGTDPVNNYMDYTSDKCRKELTTGQDVRMDEQFSGHRYTLEAPSCTDAMCFVQVDAGNGFTCGLDGTSAVQCWGFSAWNAHIPPAGKYLSVSAGEQYACGINFFGEIDCWGEVITIPDFDEPDPPTVGVFTDADTYGTSCAIDTDRSLTCWGNGFPNPLDVYGPYIQVGVGPYHLCALDELGAIACWVNTVLPVEWTDAEVPPIGDYAEVSVGYAHSCALDIAGAIQCWGLNIDGQATPPVGVFKHISSGNSFNCGIDEVDSLQCWGTNDNGESSPPLGSFVEVSAGWAHACAIDMDGVTHCWGDNSTGATSVP